MFKPCDFCNTDIEETETYAYDAKAINAIIKVRLCRECAVKERRNIKGKFREGKVKWMQEST